MNHDEYERLLNREVDGLTTPEEEAALMDHVSRSPEAAEQQAWFHRIHRSFRGMIPPVPPEGLAGRVADRVLAGGSSLSLRRASHGFARMAASFVLVLCLGGVVGYLAHGEVTGGASAEMSAEEAKWKELQKRLELSPEAVSRIRDIEARYDRLVEQKEQEFGEVRNELADRENGEIFSALEPWQQERYRQILSMDSEEVRRLLDLYCFS